MSSLVHRVVPPPAMHAGGSETGLRRSVQSYVQTPPLLQLPQTGVPTSARRRPVSSAIAASPLEKIPPRYVTEAEMLLGDRGCLDKWLAEPVVTLSLRRQGLDVRDLYSSVARAFGACQESCLVARQYARKVLAQVCWEVDMCLTSESELLAQTGMVPHQPRDLSPVPGSQSVPQGGRSLSPLTCSSVPHPPGPPSSNHWASFTVPKHASKTRPLSKAAGTDRRPSRERGLKSLEEAKRQWERKSRVFEDDSAKVSLAGSAALSLSGKETKPRARREEPKKQATARGTQRSTGTSKSSHDEGVDLCVRHAFQDGSLHGGCASSRASLQDVSRRALRKDESLRTRLTERASKAQAEADERRQQQELQRLARAQAEAVDRRQQALRARSAGPPEFRAARELAKQQASRVDRIREAEREALRVRIQTKSSPVSSRVGCRPSTPKSGMGQPSRGGGIRPLSAQRSNTPSYMGAARAKGAMGSVGVRTRSHPSRRAFPSSSSSIQNFKDFELEEPEAESTLGVAPSLHHAVSATSKTMFTTSFCQPSSGSRGAGRSPGLWPEEQEGAAWLDAPEPNLVPWPSVSVHPKGPDEDELQKASLWPVMVPEVRRHAHNIPPVTECVVYDLAPELQEASVAPATESELMGVSLVSAPPEVIGVSLVTSAAPDEPVVRYMNVHSAPAVAAQARAEEPPLRHEQQWTSIEDDEAVLTIFGILPRAGCSEKLPTPEECLDLACDAAHSFSDLMIWAEEDACDAARESSLPQRVLPGFLAFPMG